MKKLFSLLLFIAVGSFTAFSSVSAAKTFSQAQVKTISPESCVVYGGVANCFNDGMDCVYYVELNWSWGVDCGPNTTE